MLLGDWIERDGLCCLKIKLRGNDVDWDYQRIVRVGNIALERGVQHLSADFNCTVTDPAYVNAILDRLAAEHPEIDRLLLYVEQPFPYELEDFPIDVRSVAARKPLFMDESAHSWQQVRLGRSLGWTGVALKTCKTQTGALLALCWAKAHGMEIMVQDLTNPMLAQIPHVLLAATCGDDHGRRNQRDAVLSTSVGCRSRVPSRFIFAGSMVMSIFRASTDAGLVTTAHHGARVAGSGGQPSRGNAVFGAALACPAG